MIISRHPSDELYTTTQLTIICSVLIDAAVDTGVIAVNTWRGPSEALNNSNRVDISNEIAYEKSYQSTVRFDYLQSSDSGTYNCTVTISDTTSSPYIVNSTPLTADITIDAGRSCWFLKDNRCTHLIVAYFLLYCCVLRDFYTEIMYNEILHHKLCL